MKKRGNLLVKKILPEKNAEKKQKANKLADSTKNKMTAKEISKLKEISKKLEKLKTEINFDKEIDRFIKYTS